MEALHRGLSVFEIALRLEAKSNIEMFKLVIEQSSTNIFFFFVICNIGKSQLSVTFLVHSYFTTTDQLIYSVTECNETNPNRQKDKWMCTSERPRTKTMSDVMQQ